jgi:O-antigen/teichoic acid export membrane protein
MKGKSSLKINYFYNLLYNLLSILLPLLTTPYLSRILGPENIGIYGYTFSIVSYFVLFGCIGTTMYGQREIAYVQDDREKQSKVFWEILIIKMIAMFFSILIFYFAFCLDDKYNFYYKILLIYMVSNVFDISWYFQGIEEFGKIVVRNLIVKLLSIVFIFLLVKTSSDLWIYFLIFTCSELIGNVSIWYYIPKYINKVKLNKLNFKKHIGPIFALFIPQIAIQIYTVLDKTMIGVITGDMNQVGYYEQAQKIAKTALVLVTSYCTVMASRMSYSYKNKTEKENVNYIKSSFNFLWFLGLPITFGLVSISDKLVPWFYGNGYDPVCNLLKISSLLIIIIGFSSIIGVQYLVSTGREREYTLSVTMGAISNFILNSIFIRLNGATGAIIASVISEFIVSMIQLYFVRKKIKISEIFQLIPKYLISSLIMFAVLSVLEYFLVVSILNTVICIIIGMLIYAFCLFLLHDYYFLSVFSNFFKKLKLIK